MAQSSTPTPSGKNPLETEPSKLFQREFACEGLGQTFILRRLKAIDQMEISVRQSAMLRGISPAVVHSSGANMSYFIATLSVVMVKPEEFDWTGVYDDEAIEALFFEWKEFNDSFRRQQSGDAA